MKKILILIDVNEDQKQLFEKDGHQVLFFK